MSLEDAIRENTAAVRELIGAIKASGAAAALTTRSTDEPVADMTQAVRRAKASAKAESPVVAQAEPRQAAAKDRPQPEPEDKPAEPVGDAEALRDQVRDLIFKIDKDVSRAAALEVLKVAGVGKLRDAPDDKLPAIKAAAEKALA